MLESDTHVIDRFNSVMQGLHNYYCGSLYRSGLYSIYRLLKISCALTLAHRHKHRRAAKAFKCWGNDLSIEKTTRKNTKKIISLQIPDVKESCRFNI
jgi:Type II intron maturase